jgi:hypothetical protein
MGAMLPSSEACGVEKDAGREIRSWQSESGLGPRRVSNGIHHASEDGSMARTQALISKHDLLIQTYIHNRQ